jgi:hypothetical protein
MKAYILTTGVIFGLITVAHVWRMIVEPGIAASPLYIVLTLAAATLCFWSWRVLRQLTP